MRQSELLEEFSLRYRELLASARRVKLPSMSSYDDAQNVITIVIAAYKREIFDKVVMYLREIEEEEDRMAEELGLREIRDETT